MEVLDFDTENPQVLHDLLRSIQVNIPEAEKKWYQLYAMVKTYIHKEKYMIWFFINLHFFGKDYYKPTKWIDRVMARFGYMPKKLHEARWQALQEYVAIKRDTHGSEKWQSYEKNLEWALKWGAKPLEFVPNDAKKWQTPEQFSEKKRLLAEAGQVKRGY
jgi:hypothetical protein